MGDFYLHYSTFYLKCFWNKHLLFFNEKNSMMVTKQS